LEGVVTAINQTGDASTPGLSSRVDKLEGQISNLDGSIPTQTTALMQRITAAEQKITDLENTPLSGIIDKLEGQISNLDGSISTQTTALLQRLAAAEQKITDLENTPSDPPVPTAPPSDPPVPTTPPAEPPVPTTPPADPPVPTIPPSDPPIPVNPPSISITYATCITSALNVRNGPGASYPMVAGLRYGQRVKVINRQNGWAQFENPAGWSSEAYLSFEQSSSSVPVESPQPTTTPDSYGICNTSGLNVRSGPGVTYPIVGGLTYGQRIKIISHKNGWAQIETPSGWCNESYLSFA
jgi:uncharacterized protein YgiM (DUF1202 family)